MKIQHLFENKAWRLFLDDERFPAEKDKDMIIARSYNEAINLIEQNGCPIFISFDHDLGTDKTGYNVAQWLIHKDIDSEYTFIPKHFTFYVHSQNPIGKRNIEGLLQQYLDYRG